MKRNLNIEAEGSELILQNEAGDYAIIPKKYRQEVLDMIKEECYGCIDSLVETLPLMEDYADDGTVFPENKENNELIKNKSKYRPTIGDNPKHNYITDERVISKFKEYLTLNSIMNNNEILESLKNKKYPFGYYQETPFNTLAKLGTWKIDRNDEEGYYSLYNYNPFGDSFYDRVYDKEIRKFNYDEETKKRIQELYKSGVIKPLIDYENLRFGWEYDDYSKLPDKEVEDKKFVQNWFNSPESKERFIKSGGTEKEWNKILNEINKNLSTLKIKENLEIPDLYISEKALYSPYYHAVVDHFGDSYTHEITHGTHIDQNKHFSNIIKDVVNNHKIRKYDDYYHSPEEIYSRIMQIRKDFNISPKDKIDKEYLKQKIDEFRNGTKDMDELFRYIDIDGIIKLLNILAYDSENKTNDNLV